MFPSICLVLETKPQLIHSVVKGRVELAWMAAERFIAAWRSLGRNVLFLPFFLEVSVIIHCAGNEQCTDFVLSPEHL